MDVGGGESCESMAGPKRTQGAVKEQCEVVCVAVKLGVGGNSEMGAGEGGSVRT